MFKTVVQDERPNGLPPMQRTYNGFHRANEPNKFDAFGALVVVFCRCAVELWMVQDRDGLLALQAFYIELWPHETVEFKLFNEAELP